MDSKQQEVAFNQKIAKILKFILDLQTSDNPATRKDIGKFINKSRVWVGKLLKRLENDPRGFLKEELDPTDETGKQPYQYKLIRANIVTHPLTAWISLELHKETKTENEIDRSIFEKKIVDKLRNYNYKTDNLTDDLEAVVSSKITVLIGIRAC